MKYLSCLLLCCILLPAIGHGQTDDTKQNSLVVKLSATWCPVCAGAARTTYSWLFDNVKKNAFILTAHSSSTSRLYSPVAADIIRNFDQSAYQPAFYLNGANRGAGGSATEREIRNGVEDASAKTPVATLKTVARATGNTSIKAQVTITFTKAAAGTYEIGIYLVEKNVKEIQSGLTGTVDHKNILRSSFFQGSFGEPLPGTNFSSGFSRTISGNIILPANVQASNYQIVAILWDKKSDKYEVVNTHATEDLAGVLTDISERISSGLTFRCLRSDCEAITFQFANPLGTFRPSTVFLRDALGRTLSKQDQVVLSGDLQTLSFSNLNLFPGLYVISFESKDFRVSRKVLVP